jgi:hypothetical protein
MVSIYQVGLISCGGNQSAAGQMICFAEQTPGSLMDRGYCVLITRLLRFDQKDCV